MGKDNQPQKQPVTINGKEYDANTFTPEQANLLNHVVDLDRKLANMKFQADQISVGRETFIKMLEEALTKEEETPPPNEVIQ